MCSVSGIVVRSVAAIFLLAAGCGVAGPAAGEAPVGAFQQAGPAGAHGGVRVAGRGGRVCDIRRGDRDCQRTGTSALSCRTRRGERRGLCVDDFHNPCGLLPQRQGVSPCQYDQHCDGWDEGAVRCTDYGSLGLRACGRCLVFWGVGPL